MRNSSDIFCLKELKDGDTSGTQMFSVNGKCQLSKMSRTRNLHSGSSSFEYGSSTPSATAAVPSEDLLNDIEEFTNEINNNMDDINEEVEELHLGNGDDTSRSEDMYQNIPVDKYLSPKERTPVSSTTNSPVDKYLQPKAHTPVSSTRSSPSKNKLPTFRRLSNKEEEKVSESAIPRNPLTGAGVEIETHRKSKKGGLRHAKWTW